MDTFAASVFKDDAEPGFSWTQCAGHGPELLGDPRCVLEIGCGTGRALAHLAQRGIAARGVDLSPVMVKKTTTKWAGTGAEFVCSEVLRYLSEEEAAYDAVYSIFGAAWFTDPSRLFPLVRQRLRPGGVFVFSRSRAFRCPRFPAAAAGADGESPAVAPHRASGASWPGSRTSGGVFPAVVDRVPL